MSEANPDLDDFFAKKDRKKSKKTFPTNPTELVKKEVSTSNRMLVTLLAPPMLPLSDPVSSSPQDPGAPKHRPHAGAQGGGGRLS